MRPRFALVPVSACVMRVVCVLPVGMRSLCVLFRGVILRDHVCGCVLLPLLCVLRVPVVV